MLPLSLLWWCLWVLCRVIFVSNPTLVMVELGFWQISSASLYLKFKLSYWYLRLSLLLSWMQVQSALGLTPVDARYFSPTSFIPVNSRRIFHQPLVKFHPRFQHLSECRRAPFPEVACWITFRCRETLPSSMGTSPALNNSLEEQQKVRWEWS